MALGDGVRGGGLLEGLWSARSGLTLPGEEARWADWLRLVVD